MGTSFSVKLNNIGNASTELENLWQELEKYTEQIPGIISGLNSSMSYSSPQNKLRKLKDSQNKAAVSCKSLKTALDSANRFYQQTEEKLLGEGNEKEQGILLARGRKPVFDDTGNSGYGGDQGDLAENHSGSKKFGVWVWGEDKEVYKFVKTHEGYEDYTEVEIYDLLNQMNEEGCGYMGTVNAIFSEFDGSEKEFEEIFGFPMYDEDGNYNYNYMFIDIYCTTDDKFYLGEDAGMDGLLNEICNSCMDDPEGFKDKYGVDLFTCTTDGKIFYTKEARDALTKEINATYGTDAVVTYDQYGNTYFSRENRLKAYLRGKGLDPKDSIFFETKDGGLLCPGDVRRNLEDGKVTGLSLQTGTNLYSEDGECEVTIPDTNGIAHYVTITGVTDDGRYIVSSWGKKYYIDPEQAKIDSYNTINIEF